LLVRERDGVGQHAFKKPHALAKAFCPVLALLHLLFLNKPFFVSKPLSAFIYLVVVMRIFASRFRFVPVPLLAVGVSASSSRCIGVGSPAAV